MVDRSHFLHVVVLVVFFLFPGNVRSEIAVLELSCHSCGYRARLVQGSDEIDHARNVQNIIVVCERNHQIRNIKIPIDPGAPSSGEPLLAKRYGNGKSELLGVELPRFLVPGNTCPLFPIAAYLEANICPIDGSPGFTYAEVGRY